MAQILDLTVCCGKVCRFLCDSFKTEDTSDSFGKVREDETYELKQLRVLCLRNVESRNCNYLS